LSPYRFANPFATIIAPHTSLKVLPPPRRSDVVKVAPQKR
jgi:hypothetical protein